jgi:hypothetical protein
MEVRDLHLDEIHFTSAPTKTQLVNTLRDIHKFLGQVGASLIFDGSYTIAEQALGTMFNASIQLKASADQFEAGPNASGLQVPQAGPMAVPVRR